MNGSTPIFMGNRLKIGLFISPGCFLWLALNFFSLECEFNREIIIDYEITVFVDSFAWYLEFFWKYSELFWSAFSNIRNEYREIRSRITPNTDTFYAVLISQISFLWNFLLQYCFLPRSPTLRKSFYCDPFSYKQKKKSNCFKKCVI